MSHIPLPNQESDWAYLLLCVATYIGVFIGLMFVIPRLSELALWALAYRHNAAVWPNNRLYLRILTLQHQHHLINRSNDIRLFAIWVAHREVVWILGYTLERAG